MRWSRIALLILPSYRKTIVKNSSVTRWYNGYFKPTLEVVSILNEMCERERMIENIQPDKTVPELPKHTRGDAIVSSEPSSSM